MVRNANLPLVQVLSVLILLRAARQALLLLLRLPLRQDAINLSPHLVENYETYIGELNHLDSIVVLRIYKKFCWVASKLVCAFRNSGMFRWWPIYGIGSGCCSTPDDSEFLLLGWVAKLLLSDRNRKACIIRYYHVMLQETLAEDINYDVLAIG